MAKKEPKHYTLYVDGVAVRTFSRRPPKSVVEMVGLSGVEIVPPVENVPQVGERECRQLRLF